MGDKIVGQMVGRAMHQVVRKGIFRMVGFTGALLILGVGQFPVWVYGQFPTPEVYSVSVLLDTLPKPCPDSGGGGSSEDSPGNPRGGTEEECLDRLVLHVRDPLPNRDVVYREAHLRLEWDLYRTGVRMVSDSVEVRVPVGGWWRTKGGDTVYFQRELSLKYAPRSVNTATAVDVRWEKTEMVEVYVEVEDPYREYPLRLSLVLEVQSDVPFAQDVVPDVHVSVAGGVDIGTMGTTGPITSPGPAPEGFRVTWTPVPGASYYELEWVYLNRRLPDGSDLSPDRLRVNFVDRAVRVRVRQPEFILPYLYREGYIVFRVRAVREVDPEGRQRLYTRWSMEPPYDWVHRRGEWTVQDLLSSSRYADDVAEITASQEQTPEMSYTVALGQNAEGNIAYTGSYFDGYLRKWQEVAYLPSETASVVREFYYDHASRLGVQTLAAATPSGGVRYHSQFNRPFRDPSRRYSWQDYEIPEGLDPVAWSPEPMHEEYGSARYYSEENPFWGRRPQERYVPSAGELDDPSSKKGYPFQATFYLPDGTGRIWMQAGPGDRLRAGSGHEVIYLYGTPLQSELDYLFGTDANRADQYVKIYWRNAHGQWNVMYRDLEGRVVASALAGGVPDSVEAVAADSMVLWDRPIEKGRGEWTAPQDHFTKSVAFASGVNLDVRYTFDGGVFRDSCSAVDTTFCIACQWLVTYSLEHVESREVLARAEESVQADTPCVFCSPLTIASHYQEPNPEWGQYYITRERSLDTVLSEAVYDAYLAFLDRCGLLRSWEEFYEEALEELDTTTCLACASCDGEVPVDTFGDVVDQPVDSSLWSCGRYCDRGVMDWCAFGFEQMLVDVSPGGQYAMYTYDYWGEVFVPDTMRPSLVMGGLHIRALPYFVVDAFQSRYGPDRWFASFRTPLRWIDGRWAPHYYREDGTIDTLWLDCNTDSGLVVFPRHIYQTDDGRCYTFPEHLTPTAFVQLFRRSWAYSLVAFHPEYVYWWWCKHEVYPALDDAGRNPFQYDAWLDTLSYAEAEALDLIAEIAERDPIWQRYNRAVPGRPRPPYWVNPPVGQTWNPASYVEWRMEHYVYVPSEGTYLTIWQLAYLMRHAGGATLEDLKGWLTGSALSCIDEALVDEAMSLTDVSDLIFDEGAWQILKVLYWQLKQEVMLWIANRYALSQKQVNLCIGVDYPDGFAQAYYDGIWREWLPYWDEDRLCAVPNYFLFRLYKKHPVFAHPYQSLGYYMWLVDTQRIRPVEPPQLYDPNTGLCPEAQALWSLFVALSYMDTLTDSLVIPMCSGLGSVIRLILGGESSDSLCDTLYWYPVWRGDTLVVADSGCGLTVWLKACGDSLDYIDWQEDTILAVVGIGNWHLGWIGSTLWTKFTLYLQVLRDSVMRVVPVEGAVNRDLINCLKPCYLHPGARAFLAFVNEWLAKHAHPDSVYTNPEEIPIDELPPDLQHVPDDHAEWYPDEWRLVFAEAGYQWRLRFLSGLRSPMVGCIHWRVVQVEILEEATREAFGEGACQKGVWLAAVHYLCLSLDEDLGVRAQMVHDTVEVMVWLELLDEKGNVAKSLGIACCSPCEQEPFCVVHRTNPAHGVHALLETLRERNVLFPVEPYAVFQAPVDEALYSLYPYGGKDLACKRGVVDPEAGRAQLLLGIPSGGLSPLGGGGPVHRDGQWRTLCPWTIWGAARGWLEDPSRVHRFELLGRAVGPVQGVVLRAQYFHPDLGIVWDTFVVQPCFSTGGFYQCCSVCEYEMQCAVDLCTDTPGCGFVLPLVLVDTTNECLADYQQVAEQVAWQRYWRYIDSLKRDLRERYISACLTNMTETLSVRYVQIQYGWTLTYYDRAGNQVRQVPPEGVRRLTVDELDDVINARQHHTRYVPDHTKTIEARYSSTGKVLRAYHPDEGEVRYWYDYLDRIVLSQDGRQRELGRASFTVYDDLGRLRASAEMEVSSLPSSDWLTPDESWEDFRAGGTPLYDLTVSVYDRYPEYVPAFERGDTIHGRNRITASIYYPEIDALPNINNPSEDFQYAIYFAYDVHGWVPEEVHDIPELAPFGKRYTRIQRVFDLVTGKMYELSYQPGDKDAFYHRFAYDERNRLRAVWTSTDGRHWLAQARYDYYLMGALSRRELGAEWHIQGLDYTYTLLEGVKTINSERGAQYDPGRDGVTGSVHELFAEDVYSATFHYYPGDYQPVDVSVQNELFSAVLGNAPVLQKPYYNGWLSAWIFRIDTNRYRRTAPSQYFFSSYSFTYDQMGRLVHARTVEGFDPDGWTPTTTLAYSAHYTYDLDGNLQRLVRYHRDGTQPVDQLQYHYYAGTNRLEYVEDAVSTSSISWDIESQSAGNYQYNARGQLIRDRSLGITEIVWNASGRIRTIRYSSGKRLDFRYGAHGYRYKKRVQDSEKSGTYYYLYTMDGQLLAVYRLRNDTLYLDEQMVYGLKREGVYRRRGVYWVRHPDGFTGEVQTLSTTVGSGGGGGSVVLPPLPVEEEYMRVVRVYPGDYRYELSDHLGNVRVVVGGLRVPIDETGDGYVDFYKPALLAWHDYYPYGFPIPERTHTPSYLFASNGGSLTENDIADVYGAHLYTFYRIADLRLARWLSTDPEPAFNKYWLNDAKPTVAVDPRGDDTITVSNTLEVWGYSADNNPNNVVMRFAKTEGLTKEGAPKVDLNSIYYSLEIQGEYKEVDDLLVFKITSPENKKSLQEFARETIGIFGEISANSLVEVGILIGVRITSDGSKQYEAYIFTTHDLEKIDRLPIEVVGVGDDEVFIILALGHSHAGKIVRYVPRNNREYTVTYTCEPSGNDKHVFEEIKKHNINMLSKLNSQVVGVIKGNSGDLTLEFNSNLGENWLLSPGERALAYDPYFFIPIYIRSDLVLNDGNDGRSVTGIVDRYRGIEFWDSGGKEYLLGSDVDVKELFKDK